MLTKSGAKLLDFGLAKRSARRLAPGQEAAPRFGFRRGPDADHALPVARHAAFHGGSGDRDGAIHVARADPGASKADARSDIFSFGVMLLRW